MKVLSDNKLRDCIGLVSLLVLTVVGLLMAGFLFHDYPRLGLILSCLYYFLIGQCLICGVNLGKHYTLKELRGNR